MLVLKQSIPLILLAFLFSMGIIVISYKIWFGLLMIFLPLLIIYIKNDKYRSITSIFFSFLVSFLIFQLINIFIGQYDLPKEIRILLNRSLLFVIIVGLYLNHLFKNKPISFFNHKPQWGNRIDFHFHSINIFYFWLIGLIINIAIYTPFVFQQGKSNFKTILLFCILFSIINAIFEEIIWRGILFSSLQRYTSILYATIVTSIGFGLYHLAIGIPLMICLLFSLTGVYYVFIVLKTNSIYPAIIFHFVINIGMVLTGWIL